MRANILKDDTYVADIIDAALSRLTGQCLDDERDYQLTHAVVTAVVQKMIAEALTKGQPIADSHVYAIAEDIRSTHEDE